MNGGVFGGIAAAVLMFYIFPKVFALPAGYREQGPDTAGIDQRFGTLFKKSEFKALGMGVLLAVLYAALVLGIAKIASARFQGLNGTTILQPEGVAWFLPLFFGILGILSWATTWGPRIILKRQAEKGEEAAALYARKQSLKMNYRADSVGKMLTGVVSVSVALLLVLIFDNYTVIAPDAITINPFLSIGAARHPYSDVTSIVTAPRLIAPNGNTVERRLYIIRFKNGDKWDSDNGPSELDDFKKAQIVGTIARLSGKSILNKDVFKRNEL